MKYVKAMPLLLILCSIVVVDAFSNPDQYENYVGTNITVLVCNNTVVQGILVQNSEDYIVIDDLCTQEVGNVLINKNCLVMLYNGCECM